jgi:hypothetical protein
MVTLYRQYTRALTLGMGGRPLGRPLKRPLGSALWRAGIGDRVVRERRGGRERPRSGGEVRSRKTLLFFSPVSHTW